MKKKDFLKKGFSKTGFLKKGFFITFEGGEGVGKTTLMEAFGEFLEEKKIPFIKTREPGSTLLGEKIRDILLNVPCKMSSYSELCLFLASRAEHIKEVIIPFLKKGKIVLCDRFNDSTIAYQGYARGLDIDKVSFFCDFISQNLKPDLTFFLDLLPKKGLNRVIKKLDRIESEKIVFHEDVRDAYLHLIKKEPKRFVILDASLSKEKIKKEAIEILLKRLKKWQKK